MAANLQFRPANDGQETWLVRRFTGGDRPVSRLGFLRRN
jgi:hypothetical protein